MFTHFRGLLQRLFTRENLTAFLVAIFILTLIVFASNAVSDFVYAGF